VCPTARRRYGRAPESDFKTSRPIVTPDGRYIIVRGRLWRATNPALSDTTRETFTGQLMDARRTIRFAGHNARAMKAARKAVHAAKIGLGERGPVWWQDGAPDYNRCLAQNTPYARWFATSITTDSFVLSRELNDSRIVVSKEPVRETHMATKKKAKKSTKKAVKKSVKRSARGRAQDRARVAGGQDYEVAYEAKKTKKKASAVRKAVKKVGNSRKKVGKALRGR
jgi:hypothetical protein